ncbi:hypothetical protein B0T10DRAFT_456936 [Thelonectria olida]|uniref:Uncharacterized protein n=1 Tax=Thelonectria olida TaxID=1576542 RepID=A0A9P9ATA4_9HYPO|nr:hypothetical protein B0T10DRAFT_456936 [Thelonectria olida]
MTNDTAVEYLGFNCPDGGDFYICEGTWKEFFGYCTSDPCAGDVGECPQDDLRKASFNRDRYEDIPQQDCNDAKGISQWYTCAYTEPSFVGCCRQVACILDEGCPERDLAVIDLTTSNPQAREHLLNAGNKKPSGSGTKHTDLSTPTPTPTSSVNRPKIPGAGWRPFNAGEVAGVTVGVALLALIVFGLLGKVWWAQRSGIRSTPASSEPPFSHPPHRASKVYEPVSGHVPVEVNAEHIENKPHFDAGTSSMLVDIPPTWHGGPRELHVKDFSWWMEWTWDVLLTLTPIFFIGKYTQTNLCDRADFFALMAKRIPPMARWHLEQPHGIKLGALEQIFGSQSFAGSFQRLLFARTQLVIGIAILITWAMSPLGGQGSSRMLLFGNTTTIDKNGTVYYFHPSYQTSHYTMSRDIAVGKAYDVDQGALSRGDAYYASLLGIPIRGLDFANESTQSQSFDFSLETSYVDFDCGLVERGLDLENYKRRLNVGQLDLTKVFDVTDQENFNTFTVNITGPGSWGSWEKSNTPSLHLLYASLGQLSRYEVYKGSFILFNCTMQTVTLETEMRCGPRPSSTSCYARRQRRVHNQEAASSLLGNMIRSPSILRNLLNSFQRASGTAAIETASPTDNYLVGEQLPFAGQPWIFWNRTDIDLSTFSRRLTTAFNTFWFATLNPFGQTSVSFCSDLGNVEEPTEYPGSEIFMNSTEAVAKTTYNVYGANRFWVAVVLVTTSILEMLAILGLGLRLFIHGPDVLGFASSMTRENPHVPLPPGGSGLDGPDRAKFLGEVRVQLADVRAGDDVGYVALRAVPLTGDTGLQTEGNETGLIGQPFSRKRLYL